MGLTEEEKKDIQESHKNLKKGTPTIEIGDTKIWRSDDNRSIASESGGMSQEEADKIKSKIGKQTAKEAADDFDKEIKQRKQQEYDKMLQFATDNMDKIKSWTPKKRNSWLAKYMKLKADLGLKAGGLAFKEKIGANDYRQSGYTLYTRDNRKKK